MMYIIYSIKIDYYHINIIHTIVLQIEDFFALISIIRQLTDNFQEIPFKSSFLQNKYKYNQS